MLSIAMILFSFLWRHFIDFFQAIYNFSLEESNATSHKSEHDLTLRKHSEELSALNAKFQLLETVLSNKKGIL